jgi:hypothetical protein
MVSLLTRPAPTPPALLMVIVHFLVGLAGNPLGHSSCLIIWQAYHQPPWFTLRLVSWQGYPQTPRCTPDEDFHGRPTTNSPDEVFHVRLTTNSPDEELHGRPTSNPLVYSW